MGVLGKSGSTEEQKSGWTAAPSALLLVSSLPVWSGVLADLLVIIHFTFVLFVAAGGLLTFRWPRLAFVHLPAALWGAWIELSGGICPLTPIEKSLRVRAGEAAYAGDFVDHYILPMLYPSGLTRATQLWLGAGVVAVNVAIYAAVLMRGRRRS